MPKLKKKKKNHHYFLLTFLILIFLLFVLLGLVWNYIVRNAPKFDENLLYNKQATIIKDRNDVEIARLGNENRELVTYEQLPQVLIDAIIATEDSRFFQHSGFDAIRFTKATLGHLKGDSNAGGASTLTMQLSKNHFTSNESRGLAGIIRKFTDIYLSIFQIEKNYSKKEIIELYVNSPYLGSSTYGVEIASLNYFGKHVSDLTLTEASLIAGLFNAPDKYDPFLYPDEANQRRKEVLKLMYKHGYISEEQLNDELDIDIRTLLIKENKSLNKYQGFIDTVVEEVITDTGLNPYNTSMIIKTTLDSKVQDAVNNVMSNKNNFKDNIIEAGLAITGTQDGSILAVGTGRKRNGQREYNRATMIKRQPGSVIKPFMDYGPYFEYTNNTPNSKILDAPYTYSDGTLIKNALNDYKGLISVKQALYESRNIPALKVFQSVDINLISDYVHSFGIDYGQYLYESAAIGAFEGVSPLVMSAAYGAYARGGFYIKPYSYTQIIYRDTGKISTKNLKKEQVCSEQTAKYINEILSYAVQNYKIFGTLEMGDTKAAGKTGTTNLDSKTIKKLNISEEAINDSWGCIYTDEYSIALWYGYDKISAKNYMVMVDGTLGRRRIIKKLVKQLYT